MSAGPVPASAHASWTPSAVRRYRIRCVALFIDRYRDKSPMRRCRSISKTGLNSHSLNARKARSSALIQQEEAIMIKRILFFGYGVFSYLIFLGTFLYAIAFIGNF